MCSYKNPHNSPDLGAHCSFRHVVHPFFLSSLFNLLLLPLPTTTLAILLLPPPICRLSVLCLACDLALCIIYIFFFSVKQVLGYGRLGNSPSILSHPHLTDPTHASPKKKKNTLHRMK